MSISSLTAVDHIGYAVKDMKQAKKKFEALGFIFSDEKEDELRSVNVCVASKGDIRIELLSPVEGKRSPVDSYLNKIGNTPYHICYRTVDIDTTIEDLQKEGFTLLRRPAPSIPLGGDVCFLYSADIGMIELISYGD